MEERIQWLQTAGLMGFQLGIIKPRTYRHYERYKTFQDHLSVCHRRCEAVDLSARDHNIAPITVWKAIRFVEKGVLEKRNL